MVRKLDFAFIVANELLLFILEQLEEELFTLGLILGRNSFLLVCWLTCPLVA